MTIGDLARRTSVTTKAVRYYESLGLLTPERLPNGYRVYDLDDVRLVEEIKSLRRLGIPVERTRPFLECLASGSLHSDECPSSLASYRDVIEDLTERIEELSSKRSTLIQALNVAASRGSQYSSAVAESDYLSLPDDLAVPSDDQAADHLIGTAMPHVALVSTSGKTIRLDMLGDRRTVIYIYPLTGRPGTDVPRGWDSIPGARGCTPESCGFRDHFRDLLEAGAGRVFGLSSQNTDYQGEVVERLALPFDMLSDPQFLMADTLRLPTFEAGGTRLFKRLTMMVRAGLIAHVFYPIFPPNAHAQQVLNWLRSHPQ
ncbi:MerR family transcriptional regulator [Mycolicibacterium porcinum]|uniref:MerR family transcriptional regulator n=1 Tax=Mycolicibacterium porcinum TaxID=39693 RepID=A0AAW5T6Q5_9MYCO|nr:MerR family transcriptional regulator [Mycolicibacterium porcinum]MCV7390432.1 MerR family transcriptional regulator [Mycolicibacterium porcinum]ORB36185.1 peroxiredoxin [Mycolicibacterium porcinum]